MKKSVRKDTLFGFILSLALPLAWVGSVPAAAVEGEKVAASVNGEKISVRDLREGLGVVGGAVHASWIPVERKKEAVDRMIDARLLAQSARKKALDNATEFREAMARNERGIEVSALVRQEAASRVSVTKEEVREEAAKRKGKEKGLSDAEARSRASAAVWERNFRRFQEELAAEARKEASVAIDEEAIGRIGKETPPGDNAVLGTAGGEAIRYGDVKAALGAVHGGTHGGGNPSENPAAVRDMVDSALTRMSLLALAGKKGIRDSDWMKAVRREAERAVLVNLLTETVILKKVAVTDREIQDAYAKHSGMLVRDGKPIPLSEVKEQIRGIVLAGKRKAAVEKYIGQLQKKAKIQTYGKVLPKV